MSDSVGSNSNGSPPEDHWWIVNGQTIMDVLSSVHTRRRAHAGHSLDLLAPHYAPERSEEQLHPALSANSDNEDFHPTEEVKEEGQ